MSSDAQAPDTGRLLHGKRALVTGGGSGIGRAFAEALAEHGAEVVVCGRRREVVEATAAELSSLGKSVSALRCDVTDEENLLALAEAVGQLDIVVNNAGYGFQKRWTEVSLPEWREVMSINVEAPLRLAQLFVPGMIDRGWGRVVNISSVYGVVVGNPWFYDFEWDSPAYVTSKHALIGLSKYLAVRTGGTGVTVNALSPGMFPYTEANIDHVTEEGLHKISLFTPAKRVGSVSDLKSALIYLVSPASSFVTGQNIVVDGGWTLW